MKIYELYLKRLERCTLKLVSIKGCNLNVKIENVSNRYFIDFSHAICLIFIFSVAIHIQINIPYCAIQFNSWSCEIFILNNQFNYVYSTPKLISDKGWISFSANIEKCQHKYFIDLHHVNLVNIYPFSSSSFTNR